MTRLVKFWAMGSFAHGLVTFTLFPLVLVLPNGIVAELGSDALGVFLQPFMGPHPLFAADRLLVVADGLPAMAVTSALWGLLVMCVVAVTLRLRHQHSDRLPTSGQEAARAVHGHRGLSRRSS